MLHIFCRTAMKKAIQSYLTVCRYAKYTMPLLIRILSVSTQITGSLLGRCPYETDGLMLQYGIQQLHNKSIILPKTGKRNQTENVLQFALKSLKRDLVANVERSKLNVFEFVSTKKSVEVQSQTPLHL